MKKIRLMLDEYEVANLKAALEAVKYNDSPLCVLDTGDWLRDVLNALPKTNCDPNCGSRILALRANRWMIGRDGLWSP